MVADRALSGENARKMGVFLEIYRNFKGVKPAGKGGVLPRARDRIFSVTCHKDTRQMDKKGEV